MAGTPGIHLHDPQTLCRHWEDGQWSPWSVGLGDVVRSALRDLLPAVAESLTPPPEADMSVLGASADDLRAFALDGLAG